MGLTAAQRSRFEGLRKVGSSKQDVPLSDDACRALMFLSARDLGCADNLPLSPPKPDLPRMYEADDPADLVLSGPDPIDVFEALIESGPADADSYFICLARLHKGRLKYTRIMTTQPIPTIDQIGPRGLLQFGGLPSPALMAMMIWRKWMFDIDNRAGQETGYVFEPILASAIGGTPAPAKKSPIKRRRGTKKGKGRQVDCLRGDDAYEFKIRVTIAASGQGRWGEELSFPADCKHSGHRPILIVFDPTPNVKLTELTRAFEAEDGTAYIGDDAWAHLEELGGDTMALFLERYVRAPLRELLDSVPATLPRLTLEMLADKVVFGIGDDKYEVPREPSGNRVE